MYNKYKSLAKQFSGNNGRKKVILALFTKPKPLCLRYNFCKYLSLGVI